VILSDANNTAASNAVLDISEFVNAGTTIAEVSTASTNTTADRGMRQIDQDVTGMLANESPIPEPMQVQDVAREEVSTMLNHEWA
jgi:hypothetical protein